MSEQDEAFLRHRKSFYQRHEATILGGAGVLLVMGIWQAMWSAGKISPLFMSGPSAIAQRFWTTLQRGTLASDFAYSGENFIIGFLLAVAAGVVLGVLIGWYKRVEMVFGPFLNA